MDRKTENTTESVRWRQRPLPGRILGVYPQRQEGLFMQRIKILGGRITWLQWRGVAALAARYSDGFPLHVTTRQDIELHNIRAEDLSAVQQGLNELALNTFGACGDSVRNLTVCAGCGRCEDSLDLLPLAQLVSSQLKQRSCAFNLPRKFKISFSGCVHACAKPWINDLGFTVHRNGLFTVIGAGSLGARPALGIRLYEDLPARDILPLCVGALKFFERYGDRQNRSRARLRHIREKLGDQPFREKLSEYFEAQKQSHLWPDVLPAPEQRLRLLHRLHLSDGNITTEDAGRLTETAEPAGAFLRVNLEHGLELYGARDFELPGDLAALGRGPIVIACPGSAACGRGIADCWATAAKIRKVLADRATSQLRISISGCPNNCAHSAVADIGLVGIRRKQNGKVVERYRLLTGGANGTCDRLAAAQDIVASDDVPAVVKRPLQAADRR
jgi:sulfite reductase beta subunit-like hemoprotein